MTKKPWETEDWHKAKGVVAEPNEINSALARRDYSVPCESPSENLIQVVEGYWIWWCSTHHQPTAWCENAKLQLTIDHPIHKAADNMFTALAGLQMGLALNQDNETPESLRYVIKASLEIIKGALPTPEGTTAPETRGSAFLAPLKEPVLYIQKCVSGMFKDSDTIDFGARKLSTEKEIGKILAYIEDGSGKAVPK